MSIQDIFNAVLAFDAETVKAKTQAELEAGTDVEAILNELGVGENTARIQVRMKPGFGPQQEEAVIARLRSVFDYVFCDSPAGIERGAQPGGCRPEGRQAAQARRRLRLADRADGRHARSRGHLR